MVIIKLQGGLGNQMFQYAAGRSLLKQSEMLFLSDHFLEKHIYDTEHFTSRKYELNIFENLLAAKAVSDQVRIFTSNTLIFKILRRLFRSFYNQVSQHGNQYVNLSEYSGYGKLYLDGYFQSERYFNHLRPNLLKEFEFPVLDKINSEVKAKILATNSVSLHIRRGDYVSSKVINNVHGILPAKYYYDALNLLNSKYSNLSLFIFSDDILWVKKNLSFANNEHYFVDNNNKKINSWKDMALMSHCCHHIVANSSFSWWGAWLNPSKGKTVIAPKNWYAQPELNKAAKHIIPDSWIKI